MDLLALILAVMAGDQSEQAISSAVSAWITAHPEAVTTVQDGAISRAKLDADLQEKTDSVGVLKSALSGISSETRNIFIFKEGTFNGVTFKYLPDGGLSIVGTATKTANTIVELGQGYYGQYSLTVDSSNQSFSQNQLIIVLRRQDGTQQNSLNMVGTHGAINGENTEAYQFSKIDITVFNGVTYDTTLYIQLEMQIPSTEFVAPFSAKDVIAREHINNAIDYVTPQMYGAKADGVTNDYNAIAEALNSGKDVFFPAGEYYINRTLVIPDVFYRHKIFADSDRERCSAWLICDALPAISNGSAGWTISGIGFKRDAFPDITGVNPENKPYIMLYPNQGSCDLDIIIENCNFKKNYCMIFAEGRNVIIRNNLFYDMQNTGYCIYLNYPQTSDEEDNTDANNFKNNFSGFRGFLIESNRCHYTRNWLLNTTAVRCQKMKGLVIRDNYLEGAFCVIGFLNNAVVEDNVTFQVNHYDWSESRHDACFYLTEMVNTVIDGYHCSGSDQYVNKNGETVLEASYAMFLYSRGKCENCRITNVFISNYQNSALVFNGGTHSLRLDANIRKTRRTSSRTAVGFVNGLYHSIIDVEINDVTESPQEETYIIDWYPREQADDNYFRVTANFECIKYPTI